jgi:small GTP-binding protein
MPMPHRTQMQLIKRRLMGKEGTERVRELRAILEELPGYKNGPYADLRKWVQNEIEESRTRSGVVQRDSITVRREGAAQVALVGAPNAGKSSLLHALSHVQIAIGDYAFTTLRPVPALTRINGVLIQLVEIPGLIEGAVEDRGGGRALLGVLRGADAILFCQDAAGDVDALRVVRSEVSRAGITLPAMLVATKVDEAPRGRWIGCDSRCPISRWWECRCWTMRVSIDFAPKSGGSPASFASFSAGALKRTPNLWLWRLAQPSWTCPKKYTRISRYAAVERGCGDLPRGLTGSRWDVSIAWRMAMRCRSCIEHHEAPGPLDPGPGATPAGL